MARRDKLSAHTIRIGEQSSELKPLVAHDARIGSLTGTVLVDKVVHDAAEFGFQIQCIAGDAQPIGYSPSIRGIGRAATTLLMIGSLFDDWQQGRMFQTPVSST